MKRSTPLLWIVFGVAGALGSAGCMGDDLVPPVDDGDEVTYLVDLEPTANAIAYDYRGRFVVAPRLDYSLYWQAGEVLHVKERVRIRRESENRAVVFYRAPGGAEQSVTVTFEPGSLSSAALIAWENSPFGEGCTHGVGHGIELAFEGALFSDRIELKHIYDWTYLSQGVLPPSCEAPLSVLREELAAYADPLRIPNPVFRLFVASKILRLEEMHKLIQLRVTTVEAGYREP